MDAFPWLGVSVFLALISSFVFGMAIAWSIARKNNALDASMVSGVDEGAGELELENRSLRHRLHIVIAANERAKVVERALPDLRNKLERYNQLDAKTAVVQQEAVKVPVLNNKIKDLEQHILMLEPEAERALDLEADLEASRAVLARVGGEEGIYDLEQRFSVARKEIRRLKDVVSSQPSTDNLAELILESPRRKIAGSKSTVPTEAQVIDILSTATLAELKDSIYKPPTQLPRSFDEDEIEFWQQD